MKKGALYAKASTLDKKQDPETERAGFFCEACLVGKPLGDVSPDPRYCQGCYEFLLKEVDVLPLGQHPKWKPKPKISPQKTILVPQDVVSIMSTIKHKKSEVDIIQSVPPKVTYEKRGPKHKALPAEIIRQWASEGTGSRAIAGRLKAEHGIKVSYKTIQRILTRQMVEV